MVIVVGMILYRNDGLELAEVAASAAGFPRHTHDEYVVSANIDGLEAIWLDGKTFEADPRVLTVYPPGALQSSRQLGDGGWRCVSLYVSPERLRPLAGEDWLPARPDLQRPDLAAALRGLGDAPAELREEAVIGFLLNLLDSAPRRADGPPASLSSPRLRRLQERLLDQLDSPPTLDALAAEEGLSEAHLVRAFKTAAGLPPLAWLMQRRLSAARALLRQGEDIAEVALATGFADQAHFSKTFTRFCGMSPGRFRRVNF
ncbi:AraC family transcriptional regulator [uncultured Aquitalea sp.]|uniref:helix-turn-helix transcriptional regulator n=1 Tax=uncultured Aquitalea sp. TaxID=540272 RepID=UPI0025D85B67|nr:AraC family transcriptional regulator [uncultured Aquitalea sp.]